MKFIIVDIGSTFIKAGVFDIEQKVQIEQSKALTPRRMEDSDPTHYENDAGEFVSIIKNMIHDVCVRYPDTGGILFSTQQHGCVISHPEFTGDIYISWQDTRCLKKRPGGNKSYMQELKERFSQEDMAENGVYIKPALAFCNLYALFEEKQLRHDERTRVHTLGSYLIEKLTGNAVCHITNAAPMGFASVMRCSWRRDMLTQVGLDFIQLPRITDQMECCGVYEDGSASIRVFPDVGDVQTSVYGTDAQNGDLVINIATSGQLIYLTNQYVPGKYEIRPFYEHNYCNVISCMPGGRNFDVQIDYIRDIGEKIFHQRMERGEVWERIHRLDFGGGTGGLAVDCGFYELPDRLADGSIQHITHENMKLEQVIWATAVNFGQIYRAYSEILWKNQEKGRIYFSGGAILKNQELQEAIKRELGVTEIFYAAEDEVFRGMQKLALQCAERMDIV